MGADGFLVYRVCEDSQGPVQDEDDDVAQERQRIYNRTTHTDMVHIRDLTKVHSHAPSKHNSLVESRLGWIQL